ncbi:MAG: DNA-binding protein [Frankiales bacterium]|nr:DNA-binding protein [Frankiales bacterium]
MTTTLPLLLSIRPQVAAHLSAAVGDYRRKFRQMGMSTPEELEQLQDELSKVARSGLHRTDLDRLAEVADAAAVIPRLLTYAQAARALACGERTVRRLAEAGVLPKVKVGGAARVRVADLDLYVDSLTHQEAPRATA